MAQEVKEEQPDLFAQDCPVGDYWVAESHELLKASCHMTLDEQRLLLLAIGKLDSRPESPNPSLTVTITAQEFIEQWDLHENNGYRQLYRAADLLWDREITGLKGDTHALKHRWFGTEVRRIKGHGEITIYFNRELESHLLRLGKAAQYAAFQLKRVRHLGYAAQRLYRQLNRFVDYSGRTHFASVDEFRIAMDVEGRYQKFRDLRRYVIDPALKELEDYSDIRAECHTDKRGQRIVALNFSCWRQPQPHTPSRISAA